MERLIGTIRREYLDQMLFWNASDLVRKLDTFKAYYNHQRVHASLDGKTPSQVSDETIICYADFKQYRWQSHCRGLFDLPVAA